MNIYLSIFKCLEMSPNKVIHILVIISISILDTSAIEQLGSCRTKFLFPTLAVSKNFAFLTDINDTMIRIIDIKNPVAPQIIGFYKNPDNIFKFGDLKVKDDFLYASKGTTLLILQMNQNDSLVQVGNIEGSHSINQIEICENYMYILSGTIFSIWDLSNLSQPELISEYYHQSRVSSIKVSKNLVFLGGGDHGIRIIDVHDPAKPFLAGVYNPGSVMAIAVKENYIFVANKSGDMEIIDISDPEWPFFVTSYRLNNYIYNIEVHDNRLYLACSYDGVQIFDIQNPIEPEFLGAFDTPFLTYDLFVKDSLAYVLDNFDFIILDVKDPSSPSNTFNYSLPKISFDFVISNNNAFIAGNSQWAGVMEYKIPSIYSFQRPSPFRSTIMQNESFLHIVDLQNPVSPQIIYNYPMQCISDIVISNNYAYVTDYKSGLFIIDISDLSSPNLVGVYNNLFTYEKMALSKTHAFIFTLSGNLEAINITDPSSPKHEGFVFVGHTITAATVQDSFVYACVEGLSTFRIVDIQDPSNMKIIGSSKYLQNPFDFAISEDYAYIASGLDGLVVLDISSPSQPALIGQYPTPGNAVGITLSGNYAYIADGNNKIQVFDISNPLNVKHYGTALTNQGALSLAVNNGYLYSVEGYYGLSIVPLDSIITPVKGDKYSTTMNNHSHVFSVIKKTNHYLVSFTVPHLMQTEHRINLSVYNIKGQLVKTLLDEFISAGSFVYAWEGTDNRGNLQPSGLYIVKLKIKGLCDKGIRVTLLR